MRKFKICIKYDDWKKIDIRFVKFGNAEWMIWYETIIHFTHTLIFTFWIAQISLYLNLIFYFFYFSFLLCFVCLPYSNCKIGLSWKQYSEFSLKNAMYILEIRKKREWQRNSIKKMFKMKENPFFAMECKMIWNIMLKNPFKYYTNYRVKAQ